MAIDYKKIEIHQYPREGVAKDTAEHRFWSKYKPVFEFQEPASLSIISSRNERDQFAYAFASTAKVYSSYKNAFRTRAIGFKSDVASLHLRDDGALLGIGLVSGQINVFEVKTKKNMVHFNYHKKPVHCLSLSELKPWLYSGGDDYHLRVGDVSIGSLLRTISNVHSDRIKAVLEVRNQPQVLLTASYDKTIKIFDLRSPNDVKRDSRGFGSQYEAGYG